MGLKKMSKQIFIFPRKSGEKDGRRGDMTALHGPGRHVSRAVISFFMGGYGPGYTLRSFTFKPRPRNIWPGGLIYTQA